MPDTLHIGQDFLTTEPEHIFSEDDFVRMVFERLGPDAESYVKSIIEARDEAMKEVEDFERRCFACPGYSNGYEDGARG